MLSALFVMITLPSFAYICATCKIAYTYSFIVTISLFLLILVIVEILLRIKFFSEKTEHNIESAKAIMLFCLTFFLVYVFSKAQFYDYCQIISWDGFLSITRVMSKSELTYFLNGHCDHIGVDIPVDKRAEIVELSDNIETLMTLADEYVKAHRVPSTSERIYSVCKQASDFIRTSTGFEVSTIVTCTFIIFLMCIR